MIDALAGDDQWLPACFDEGDRGVVRHLARSGRIHRAHDVNGVQNCLRRRRRLQPEHVQQFRSVAPQHAVVVADQVQMVECRGLGELSRVGHALCECGPRNDGLDGGVRVGARFFGCDQRPPDLRVQEHLVVDRFPLLLELLLMLVLGGAKHLDHDPVVQVDQLVDDGGHALDRQRDQGRITPLILELGQIVWLHLRTFPRHLQQPILMNLAAYPVRQGERLEDLETLDVFPHVPGVRLQRRLAQPHQPGDVRVRRDVEQIVQSSLVVRLKRFQQCPVDAPVGARHGFRADSFDDRQCRQDDVPLPQRFQGMGGEYQALVGLHREVRNAMRQFTKLRQAKRGQAKIGA